METDTHDHNPDYIHHKEGGIMQYLREIVFGVQDGMVSTLGAITGIAIGSQDTGTVVLAGVAIIAVESVSMAIGSYVSSHSEEKLKQRVISEEKEEIRDYPEYEREEMEALFKRDGWPDEFAKQMADHTSGNHQLLLKEMTYRELGINPHADKGSIGNGVAMFFAYAIGGLIPLTPYFVAPVQSALPISIAAGLVGLFVLGVVVARYTAQAWVHSGARLLLLGGVALAVGFVVGSVLGV